MKLSHIRPSLFALVALLIVASMVLAACGSPAAEPSNPTVIEVPTTESATPIATGILLTDAFDNNDNNWNLIEEDGNSVQIQDGQLIMRFEKEDYWFWRTPQVQLSNVDMSFDATLKEGTPSNAVFGALCRATNNDNHFYFGIEGDGYYQLGKLVNGTWETLIDWTASTAIKPGVGETNRIRVVCSGSDLELYVNDQPVIKTQDTSLAAGGPALFAARFKEDDMTVSVAFDNLEIKNP